MSKRALRIPRLRAGRRVRWTFEVSADVDGNGPRTKKASSKLQRTTRAGKSTRDASAHRTKRGSETTTAPGVPTATRTASPAVAMVPAVTSVVAHPTPPARRGTHLQMVAAAMITMFVVTLALSRRPAPLAAAAVPDAQPEQLQQSSDITLGA